MSQTTVNVPYAIKCGSTLITQLNDATLATNLQTIMNSPPGTPRPLLAASVGQRPEMTFSTTAVKTWLGLVGLSGGNPGTTNLYSRKHVNKTGAVAIATTEHSKWTSTSVLGVCDSITASNRQSAVAQGRALFLKSGATASLVYAGNTALDAFTTANEHFILGPIVLAGATVEGTTDLNISLNHTIEQPEDDFQFESEFACVLKSIPSISFTTTSMSVWSLHNTAITSSAPFKANLLRLQNKTVPYADADTQHLLFVANDALIQCESIGGANKQLTRVKIDPISADNSAAALTYTPDSAVEAT